MCRPLSGQRGCRICISGLPRCQVRLLFPRCNVFSWTAGRLWLQGYLLLLRPAARSDRFSRACPRCFRVSGDVSAVKWPEGLEKLNLNNTNVSGALACTMRLSASMHGFPAIFARNCPCVPAARSNLYCSRVSPLFARFRRCGGRQVARRAAEVGAWRNQGVRCVGALR